MGSMTMGVSDLWCLAAQGDADSRPVAQRSGHGGPPPRHLGSGPFRRAVWMGVHWGFRSGWLGDPTCGFRSRPAQRSGHGGLPPRDVCSGPFRRPVWMGAPRFAGWKPTPRGRGDEPEGLSSQRRLEYRMRRAQLGNRLVSLFVKAA